MVCQSHNNCKHNVTPYVTLKRKEIKDVIIDYFTSQLFEAIGEHEYQNRQTCSRAI